MTRTEHMEWAKGRALEYLDASGPNAIPDAVGSLVSDLGKHDETRNHGGIMLTAGLLLGGHLRTIPEARKHIEGFQ